MKISELEDLFEFANFDGGRLGNRALVNIKDGRSYMDNEFGDEIEEEPEDLENGDWVELPGKRDLDLGNQLVEKFVDEECPQLAEKVSSISGKGFYGRFKVLLDAHDLLEAWHTFENANVREALIAWAEMEKIPLE